VTYRIGDKISDRSKRITEAAWYKIEAAVDINDTIKNKYIKFKFIISQK